MILYADFQKILSRESIRTYIYKEGLVYISQNPNKYNVGRPLMQNHGKFHNGSLVYKTRQKHDTEQS